MRPWHARDQSVSLRFGHGMHVTKGMAIGVGTGMTTAMAIGVACHRRVHVAPVAGRSLFERLELPSRPLQEEGQRPRSLVARYLSVGQSVFITLLAWST